MTAITQPVTVFNNSDGLPLDNGMIYIGSAADVRDNLITVYRDAALTIPWTQPIRTVAGFPAYQGAPSKIYFSGSSCYVTVLEQDGTVVLNNVAFNGLDGFNAFIQTVLDDTSASELRNTIGIGTQSLGTVATGTVIPWDTDVSFTGNASGTSTLYAHRHLVTQQGANNTASVRVQYNGTEITGSGTCTLAVAAHNYVWAKDSAAITFGRVIEAHMVSSSSANINDFIAFNAVSLTHTGSGTIASSIGYSCGDISDATKVTNATGFYCSNLTGATGATAAFRTDMMSGSDKTAFYSSGTAQNIFAGYTAIGFDGTPLYPLHVSASVAGGFSSQIANTHPTNPFGLRVSYTAAAPNTTDNEFIRFEDSGTTRFAVMSNGSIRINGTQVVSTRGAAVTAPAGGATIDSQARTAINDLISRLQAHGLIS